MRSLKRYILSFLRHGGRLGNVYDLPTAFHRGVSARALAKLSIFDVSRD